MSGTFPECKFPNVDCKWRMSKNKRKGFEYLSLKCYLTDRKSVGIEQCPPLEKG